jgi:prophage regulatory protein
MKRTDKTVLRKPEVLAMTSLSASTLDRLERAGDFPSRRRLGPHSVGWLNSEVQAWVAERPAVVLGSDQAQ